MLDYHRTSIRAIQAAVQSGRLVVVVGSGVSMNSGLPGWGHIIHAMADDLGRSDSDARYSSDDYMKIPQLYYNQRGETEYFRKIDELFDINLEPCLLHRLLFDLDPAHIVTTNYDALIERAAARARRPFHVVRADDDLPFAKYPRLIIKMHGDLALHNIVLKEDDYLSYQNNFPLIDKVVKSLFATHLIVFVGFSASDPNFKIMYQWVKDALHGAIQPAYLLDVESQYDYDDFTYFKSKGINILYWSVIKTSLTQTTSVNEQDFASLLPLGQDLYRLLDYIRAAPVSARFADPLEWIIELLLPLYTVRALLPYQIAEILNAQEQLAIANHDFLILDDSKLNNIILSLKSYTLVAHHLHNRPRALRMLRDILSRSHIMAIGRGDQPHTSIHIRSISTLWSESDRYRRFLMFDFAGIEALLQQEGAGSDSVALATAALERGKLLSMIGFALEAHRAYEEATKLSIEGNNEWDLIVSYFNRRQIARIMWVNLVSYRPAESNALLNIYAERHFTLEDQFGSSIREQHALYALVRELEEFRFARYMHDQMKEVAEGQSKMASYLEQGNAGFISPDPDDVGEFLLETFESFVFRNHLLARHDPYTLEFYRHYCRGKLVRYWAEARFERRGRLTHLWAPRTKEMSFRTLALCVHYITAPELDDMLASMGISAIALGAEDLSRFLSSFVNIMSFAYSVEWELRLCFFELNFRSFLVLLALGSV